MVFGEVTNYLDMFIMVSCRFSDRQRAVLAIVQLLSIKKNESNEAIAGLDFLGAGCPGSDPDQSPFLKPKFKFSGNTGSLVNQYRQ
jgi:hypothetical protein